MNDMLFTDPTQRLFNIRIGVRDRCMHLYYSLKEDWQVLRYEKFYSKGTDQGYYFFIIVSGDD